MPKPQRKIFCKSSRKSISYSSEKSSPDKKCIKSSSEQSLRKPISYSSSVKSSSEQSPRKLISYSNSDKSSVEHSPRKSNSDRESSKSSSPEKSMLKQSFSPVKDDTNSRKRLNESPTK